MRSLFAGAKNSRIEKLNTCSGFLNDIYLVRIFAFHRI